MTGLNVRVTFCSCTEVKHESRLVNLIYTYILHTRTVKAFLQILSSYINVKKESAVHITSSIILRRHRFLNISTREIEKERGGERYKKYAYLYKYKFKSNRIAFYIKEHRRDKRLLREETQKVSPVK